MKPSDRDTARRRAQDAFTRAAAALTEPTTDALAFALLEATKGVMVLAEIDVGQKAKARVEAYLREIIAASK